METTWRQERFILLLFAWENFGALQGSSEWMNEYAEENVLLYDW